MVWSCWICTAWVLSGSKVATVVSPMTDICNEVPTWMQIKRCTKVPCCPELLISNSLAEGSLEGRMKCKLQFLSLFHPISIKTRISEFSSDLARQHKEASSFSRWQVHIFGCNWHSSAWLFHIHQAMAKKGGERMLSTKADTEIVLQWSEVSQQLEKFGTARVAWSNAFLERQVVDRCQRSFSLSRFKLCCFRLVFCRCCLPTLRLGLLLRPDACWLIWSERKTCPNLSPELLHILENPEGVRWSQL